MSEPSAVRRPRSPVRKHRPSPGPLGGKTFGGQRFVPPITRRKELAAHGDFANFAVADLLPVHPTTGFRCPDAAHPDRQPARGNCSSSVKRCWVILPVSVEESEFNITHWAGKCFWQAAKSSAVAGSDQTHQPHGGKAFAVFQRADEMAEDGHRRNEHGNLPSFIQSASPVTPLSTVGNGHSAAPLSSAHHSVLKP